MHAFFQTRGVRGKGVSNMRAASARAAHVLQSKVVVVVVWGAVCRVTDPSCAVITINVGRATVCVRAVVLVVLGGRATLRAHGDEGVTEL